MDDPGGFRDQIAEQARDFWGSTVLADAGAKPGWRRDVEQRRAA